MKKKIEKQKGIPPATWVIKFGRQAVIAENIVRTDFGCEFVISFPPDFAPPRLKSKLPASFPRMKFRGFKQASLGLVNCAIKRNGEFSKAHLKYGLIPPGGRRKGSGRKKLGKVFFAKRVHPQHVVLIEKFIRNLPAPSRGGGVK